MQPDRSLGASSQELSPIPTGPYGEIADVGSDLRTALVGVVADDDSDAARARLLALGLDKVLVSRLQKALRQKNPAALLYHVPGPAPLRRLVEASRKGGLSAREAKRANKAIDRLERFIQEVAGGRSSFATALAAWVPEARAEFELRRKQSAFRAHSELRGVSTELDLSIAFLHPSRDEGLLDVVWIHGLLGLRQLRAGANVRLSSRRLVDDGATRHATTLDGRPLEGAVGDRLHAFCDGAPVDLEAHQVGDAIHYALAPGGFDPTRPVDMLLAEVNEAEMPSTPRAGRRGYVYADVVVPARRLQFDVYVHRGVYGGAAPELLLHDTATRGVVDANDPAREFDRLDLLESVAPIADRPLGPNDGGLPRYEDLVDHVCDLRGWRQGDLAAWRCLVEYPLHGLQVTLAFPRAAR